MQWPFQGHSARTKPATYMSLSEEEMAVVVEEEKGVVVMLEGSSDGGGEEGGGCGGGVYVHVYDAKKVTCKFLSRGRSEKNGLHLR